MNKISILTVALVCAFSLISKSSRADLDNTWSDLRRTHPLLIQDFFVHNDGDLLHIIFTEPPADFFNNIDEISDLVFGENLVETRVKKHRVGFDGWARDLIFSTQLKSVADIEHAIRQLHVHAFDTDYKASYRVFEPKNWMRKTVYLPGASVPNLMLSHSTLYHWLYAKEALFQGRAGQNLPINQLLAQPDSSVFYSAEPGLVFLKLYTNRSLNDQLEELRIFTLDSDLIIGAARPDASEMLVLIGRERQVDTHAAQPLRLDTILELAANKSKDLAQSYERNLPFAGRVKTPELESSINKTHLSGELTREYFAGGVDWAPILLSHELTHTEFGHLLNITDQILKSWSLSGDIEYSNFNYTQPTRFPTTTGVMDWLENLIGVGIQSLTFNWNTAGYGSWVEFNHVEIFSVNRTGSLPVSYLPDLGSDDGRETENTALRKAEDKYWDFFANLSNPDLVRVGQYTALHQIFSHVPIPATRASPEQDLLAYRGRWRRYGNELSNVMDRIESLDLIEVVDDLQNQFIEQIADQMFDSEENPLKSFQDQIKRSTNHEEHEEDSGCANINLIEVEKLEESRKILTQLWSGEDEIRDAIIDRTSYLNSKDPLRQIQSLGKLVEETNSKISRYNNLVDACSVSQSSVNCDILKLVSLQDELSQRERQIEQSESRLLELERIVEASDQIASIEGFSVLLRVVGNCNNAIKAVIEGNVEHPDAIYKTPSIVVSSPREGWYGIGGHNIDGRTASVRTSRSLPAGEFRIDAQNGRITLSGADVKRAPDVVRIFERQWRTYEFGTQRDKDRILRELRLALVAPKQDTIPFSPAALGRVQVSSDAPRGLGVQSVNRSFINGTKSRSLEGETATNFQNYAEKHQAQIVTELVNGEYRVYRKGRRPPMIDVTQSPTIFNRLVSENVQEVARKHKGEDPIAVISREGVSEAAMLNIRTANEAREIVAAAAGGGGRIPPRNQNRFFYPGDPPSNGRSFANGAGRGSDGWRPFRIVGKIASGRKLLRERNVVWGEARIQAVATQTGPHKASVRLEIPVEKQPAVIAHLRAIFSRKVKNTDLKVLESTINNNLRDAASVAEKNSAERPDIGTVLTSIRDDYRKALDNDPDLRGVLSQGTLDFEIVKNHAVSKDVAS